ncbi:hypothetical protein [Altericroceibacterium xinjiangense]|uniref:hypothetical protein n=1 Tax=Altericroceibacterium xinjiangense TaxID=762261 RepID=UPI000F7F34F7|nr:hypothetical protein [Altericroceibacterium xinjiangense]
MIRATRRQAMGGLAGALAVPTVAGLAGWRWQRGEGSRLIHDPALEAGRRFAAAGAARGSRVQAVEGDRIRFARTLLEENPALIAGVTRHADALLIADVAREAGYTSVATLHGRAGACTGNECAPGWTALGRMAQAADSNWVEALADYAANPEMRAQTLASASAMPRSDRGLVLGWVLARA